MKYYYAENNIKHGPFTLEELKKEPIKKSTLVWREDMADWKKAEEVEETKQFAAAEPPPLPNQTPPPNIKNNVTLSESTPITLRGKGTNYEKETEAVFVGIALFIAPIFINLFMSGSTSNSSSYYNSNSDNTGTYCGIALFMIVARIICAYWVNSIAGRQNRNLHTWVTFGFFFPSITLIIIGTLDRLPLEINIDNNLSSKEQSRVLVNQAMKFMDDNRMEEAMQLIDTALQIDPTSEFGLYRKARLLYYLKSEPDSGFTIFQQVLESEKYGVYANYYSGLIQIEKKNWVAAKPYLERAEAKGDSKSTKLLQRYYVLKGKYVLTENELADKIGNLNMVKFSGRYLNGIKEIDQDKFSSSLSQSVLFNKLGLSIIFGKKEPEAYVGILYIEMKDIKQIVSGKIQIIAIELLDSSVLNLTYDDEKDYDDCLALLAKLLMESNLKDCSIKSGLTFKN